MVNTGRPSRGCRTCIRRKVKCDEQRPICGQCMRGNRSCGGFRDDLDTMFFDQSEMVRARVTGQPETRLQPSTGGSLPDGSGWSSSSSSSHSSSPSGRSSTDRHSPANSSVKLSEETGLITFFTNNFTCSGRPDARRNLYWVPANFDDLIQDTNANLACQAVGAMALARLRRSSYYLREAQKKYGRAMLGLARDSQQESYIHNDAMLICAQFLGFFEVVACYDKSSRESWSTHLNGVASVFIRRRQPLTSTMFGAQMVMQTRKQSINSALFKKEPVLPVFSRPAIQLPRSLSPYITWSHDLDAILISLAELQSLAQSPGRDPTLLQRLQATYKSFCDWEAALPISLSFSKQPNTFQDGNWWSVRHDVYTSLTIRTLWNTYRAARLIAHRLIQQQSSPSLDTAGRTMSPEVRELVIDICATIPTCYQPQTPAPTPTDDDTKPLLGTVYWLFQPLEAIGIGPESPPELIAWVVACLKRIHDTTGIAVAEKLYLSLSRRINPH